MDNQDNSIAKEEKKPTFEQEDGEESTVSEHINLKVVGSDQAEVLFKIKKNTPLKKLMDAYCKRAGKDVKTVRFLYDGVRVLPTNNPVELEMEDGDTIDVMVEQIGGSF